MSTLLGYIVQYQNDEDYTPYHGNIKLHRVFQDALVQAREVMGAYLETHLEGYDGPFDTYTPSKKNCDDAGSAVIFRSVNCIIWIDRIVE
jgi:hypothetical protein